MGQHCWYQCCSDLPCIPCVGKSKNNRTAIESLVACFSLSIYQAEYLVHRHIGSSTSAAICRFQWSPPQGIERVLLILNMLGIEKLDAVQPADTVFFSAAVHVCPLPMSDEKGSQTDCLRLVRKGTSLQTYLTSNLWWTFLCQRVTF